MQKKQSAGRSLRHVRTSLPVLLALSAVLGASAPFAGAVAQSCPTCRIEFRHVATVGGTTDTILMLRGSQVARDSRGRIYVPHVATRGAIAVYDSDGSFLTTVGQSGDGPGEFPARVSSVGIGPGDSLFAFVTSALRVTVFSSTHAPVRTFQYPPSTLDYVILPDGRLITNSLVRSPDLAGYPLHLVGADGTIIRSFGVTTYAAAATASVDAQRRLLAAAPGSSASVWATHLNEYRIEHWDTSGTLIRTIERDAPWFRSTSAGATVRAASVRAISLDSAGRLWAWSQVPSDNSELRELPAARLDSAPPGDQNFDSVLEVMNTSTGAVLAAARFPFPPLISLDHGFWIAERETSNGVILRDVWQASLRVDTLAPHHDMASSRQRERPRRHPREGGDPFLECTWIPAPRFRGDKLRGNDGVKMASRLRPNDGVKMAFRLKRE